MSSVPPPPHHGHVARASGPGLGGSQTDWPVWPFVCLHVSLSLPYFCSLVALFDSLYDLSAVIITFVTVKILKEPSDI